MAEKDADLPALVAVGVGSRKDRHVGLLFGEVRTGNDSRHNNRLNDRLNAKYNKGTCPGGLTSPLWLAGFEVYFTVRDRTDTDQALQSLGPYPRPPPKLSDPGPQGPLTALRVKV
ncbi:hypothetical protein GCM10010344_14010 [Streptomyces bluensis]|nr:hypothetical protein GCM10010344_14010 [Streptomyces bluensis]